MYENFTNPSCGQRSQEKGRQENQIVLQMYETLVEEGKDACLSNAGIKGCKIKGKQNCRKALHSS